MLISFLRYLIGYVKFSVKGEFPERLFNQLATRNISVWNMRRNKATITACISAKDYLKMREYRGKNRVRTRVLKRFGLPFILKRYRLRVGFAAGLLFYITTLVIMSGFVWNITVLGNDKISSAEITSALKELGLSEGVRISKLDTELLRTRLALKVDGIAWSSINIEGVRATVNISEALGTEKSDNRPCNLIAERDGVILGLEVTEGSIAVKTGQTVAAGDLLVSGITEYKDSTASIGPSTGAVYARTSRTLTVRADFNQTETVCSDKIHTRSVLSFFGLKIPLYLGSLKGDFDIESEEKVYQSGGMYLPIKLTTARFTETYQRDFKINAAEAETLALEKLKTAEESELAGTEILSREMTVLTDENGVIIIAAYVCRENIAKKDLLLIYEDK